MVDAFWWLPEGWRWLAWGAFVVASVGIAAALEHQGRPLRNRVATRGILSYEFAWNREVADQVRTSWEAERETARLQLLYDFGFLAVYPLAFALGCAMLAGSRFNAAPAVGVFLSWAVLAAGPLDAVENVALLRMLDRGASDALARLAAWCAGLKFVLVYAAAGYLLLQGTGALVGLWRGGPTQAP